MTDKLRAAAEMAVEALVNASDALRDGDDDCFVGDVMNTDHVVMLKDTSTIKCMHCGMTYDINVPCPSSVFVAILNAYVKSHKHCELTKAEKAIKYVADLYSVSSDTAVAVYKDEIEAYVRLLEREEKEND